MDRREQVHDRTQAELPHTGPRVGTEIDRAIERLESAGVQIPKAMDVFRYLENHSDLVGTTESICETTAARFGTEAKLSLEVFSAVRNNEIDEYLTLYVWMPVFDDDVYKFFDNISEEFSSELSDKSGWIHLSYDFSLR